MAGINAWKGKALIRQSSGCEERELMKCKHLENLHIMVCRANEKPYGPSLFQLEEYCMTEEHRKCPFFMKKEEGSGCRPSRLSR
jgi:hypothetical protein